MMRRKVHVAVFVLLGLRVSASRLEAQGAREGPAESSDGLTTVLQQGALLPGALAPRVGQVSAMASGFGGYDAARSSFVGGAFAEVRVWGPFALRGGAEYSTTRKEMRPTIGGRLQLLRQGKHGIDGSLSIFYRPEGFTEPEGEIESFVSLGRRFGPIALFGNLVYGQDPEGNERDGEVRLASLYGVGRWAVGLDSRFRFALGPQRGPTASAEPRLDLLLGPVVAATVGSLAPFVHAGPSVLKQTDGTSVGVAALAGVGSAF